jgi:hypothetical protein
MSVATYPVANLEGSSHNKLRNWHLPDVGGKCDEALTMDEPLSSHLSLAHGKEKVH